MASKRKAAEVLDEDSSDLEGGELLCAEPREVDTVSRVMKNGIPNGSPAKILGGIRDALLDSLGDGERITPFTDAMTQAAAALEPKRATKIKNGVLVRYRTPTAGPIWMTDGITERYEWSSTNSLKQRCVEKFCIPRWACSWHIAVDLADALSDRKEHKSSKVTHRKADAATIETVEIPAWATDYKLTVVYSQAEEME